MRSSAYLEAVGLKGQRELGVLVAFPTYFQIDFPELYQFTAPPLICELFLAVTFDI